MNLSSNRRHKQRLSDQTLDSQDSRADSKEDSGESSEEDDDDEDEDHSTVTEESEESTDKKREWEALAKYLKSQRAYIERNSPDSFHRIPGAKKETRDKMTQKNLMSPMPSIWKPPVYKEVSATPNFKVIKSKEIKEKESEFEDVMLRYITKLQATNIAPRNECKKSCSQKPTPSERIKKLCLSQKKQPEYKPKRGRREDVHTCMDSAVSSFVGYIPQVEDPKDAVNERGLKIHSKCGLPIRYYRECDETGKFREKLVYVVEEEEEGKSAGKMQTDLISLNEILAIKQDLLELSEFAKKLKELKLESEKKKNFEGECKCKPLTELLRDVNKRMESLEARQEELERGIQKSQETETDTKKTNDTKTSASPPLEPAKADPSAVKSVSSFKTELSREGGAFSKNLEIVNELLDIKSQLQKLERKRLSKELSPDIGPAGSSKTAKQKDHAINVFSSKTYILTSEQYKKKKTNKETDLEEKGPIPTPLAKEKTAVSMEGQQGNDFVADWIKNISTPENQNSHLKVFASPNGLVKNEIKREESWQTRSVFKKDGDRNLEEVGFGNQEPQKNRAKDTGRYETSQMNPKYNREIPSYLSRKEGRLASEELSWRNKLAEKASRDTAGNKTFTKITPPSLKRSFVKPLKIVSSNSIPSVLAVKEEIQRMNCAKKISKASVIVKPSRSKSVQEFTSASYMSKDEKMILNTCRKNMEATCAQVKEKEKEEFQRQANRLPKVNKNIHLDRSMLVAAVNLDEGSTSMKYDRSRSQDFPMPVFPFPILPPEMYKILECCEKGAKKHKERENLCQMESPEHRPRKSHKEKDPVKECLKKCCKKKTRVKCSRNHCCDKKARREASRSSYTQKDSTVSCTSGESRKEAKKCQKCKKCKHSNTDCKTCSFETISSSEKKAERKCRNRKAHQKKKKCRRCSSSSGRKRCKHHRSSCQARKMEKEDVRYHTTEESEISMECRKPQRENSKISSLKYCKPTNRAPSYCDDSCYASTFWKSLRKLYPRFSALQFMSWLKLYCQEEKKSKQNFQNKQKEVEIGCKPPKEKHRTHESPDCQYCKCYRMSTFRQKWPDVSLSSKISEDNITEAETRSSNTSGETDFMFPYRKSKPFYAYKATHDEDKRAEENGEKESTNTKHNGKTRNHGGEMNDHKKCQCDRCGHVHSRKKKRKKKVSYDQSTCNNTECDSEEETKKKSSKKGAKKPKRSIFSRLGDVRTLRVCEGKLKCPGAHKVKSLQKWYRNGNSKSGKCNCESKFLALENRVHNLEKRKKKKKHKEEEYEDEDESNHHNNNHKSKNHKNKHKSNEHHKDKERKKKEKEERKERKKEEKKEKECIEGNCSNEEMEKKRKKKKKRKHSSDEDNMINIYNCDCLKKGHATAEASSAPTAPTKSPSGSATHILTSTMSPSQSEKSSFRQNLQRKKDELMGKLSSLTSYWRNFRRRRKTSDDTDLLDDSSKSGALPNARSMQPSSDEPSILGKMKRRTKHKNEKKGKEKRVQKSKPKHRRRGI